MLCVLSPHVLVSVYACLYVCVSKYMYFYTYVFHFKCFTKKTKSNGACQLLSVTSKQVVNVITKQDWRFGKTLVFHQHVAFILRVYMKYYNQIYVRILSSGIWSEIITFKELSHCLYIFTGFMSLQNKLLRINSLYLCSRCLFRLVILKYDS